MLKNMPILARDSDGRLYTIGKADVTKGGQNVYVVLNVNEDGPFKASRHSSGLWSGYVGRDATDGRPFEARVPTSEVTAEQLCMVPVDSNLTLRAKPYYGPKAENHEAFVFPTSAFQSSNVAFGASLVDLDSVDRALAELGERTEVVSASTYRDTGLGKAVLLWVGCPRSA